MSTVTMHFNLAEPICSDEELTDIIGHMEAAGFQIGLMLDAAESMVEDGGWAKLVDFAHTYPDVDELADGMSA